MNAKDKVSTFNTVLFYTLPLALVLLVQLIETSSWCLQLVLPQLK